MRDHPIPQDIVGYRFHIVGNMTIKQFAEVGAGCLMALIIYQSNLLFPIKWALIGLSISIGTALAFLPIEERPLDHWLLTFVRILYKPTKFFWRRAAKIPDAFLYQSQDARRQLTPEIDLSPARRQRIKDYLTSVGPVEVMDELERHQQATLDNIMAVFNQVRVNEVRIGRAKSRRPRLKIRARSLGHFDLGEVKVVEETTNQELGTNRLSNDQLRSALNLRAPLSVTQVAQDINIPQLNPVEVEAINVTNDQSATSGAIGDEADNYYVSAANPTLDPSYQLAAAATFNQDLPFPDPPHQPNQLVGMILTPQNELVNDAIVEIINDTGATLRAVKTNALGQFFVTTPLPSGNYTLQVDHEDLSFSPLQISLTGQVIPPVEIRSIV